MAKELLTTWPNDLNFYACSRIDLVLSVRPADVGGHCHAGGRKYFDECPVAPRPQAHPLDTAGPRADLQCGRRGHHVQRQDHPFPLDSRYRRIRLGGNHVRARGVRLSSDDRGATSQDRATGGRQIRAQFPGHCLLRHRHDSAVLRLQEEVGVPHDAGGERRHDPACSYSDHHAAVAERSVLFSRQPDRRSPEINLLRHFVRERRDTEPFA